MFRLRSIPISYRGEAFYAYSMRFCKVWWLYGFGREVVVVVVAISSMMQNNPLVAFFWKRVWFAFLSWMSILYRESVSPVSCCFPPGGEGWRAVTYCVTYLLFCRYEMLKTHSPSEAWSYIYWFHFSWNRLKLKYMGVGTCSFSSIGTKVRHMY